MSWDLYAMRYPVDAKTVDDIRDDFAPQVIATRSEIIGLIREVVPTANFADPSYGEVETPNYSIGISLGARPKTAFCGDFSRLPG
jgi:hypothetical protein